MIIGGIVSDNVLPNTVELCRIDPETMTCQRWHLMAQEQEQTRPLLIGTSAILVPDHLDNLILIMGGSAVCFSFGTHLNTGCYTVRAPGHQPHGSDIDTSQCNLWQYVQSIGFKAVGTTVREYADHQGCTDQGSNTGKIETVAHAVLQSKADFEKAMSDGKPVIFKNLDLGPCKELWTPEYLKERIPVHEEVGQSHECVLN